MEYTFVLEINSVKDKTELERILELRGNAIDNDQWNYEIKINEKDNWVDFISVFYNALNGKMKKLKEIGINENDITIWFNYAYKQQCNIEFNASDLKKLASIGVSLCISCWEE